MGKTIRGSKPVGYDFWTDYSCNRGGGSYGKYPKDLADSERRNKGKKNH